ncbi:MAG TPA: SOS response-associated peptidase [Bacteroidia bacterium]|nr:SOS response-associated peptidase [Bacteroidia bacterium]
MCYTTQAQQDMEKLARNEQKILQAAIDFKQRVELSGFAHPMLPVCISEETKVIQPMRWGLIPFWVKTEHEAQQIANKTLNARAETIFKLPSFRSISKRRCLIYVSGFYEWQHRGKEKIKYLIKVKDAEYFALGGLYDEWVNPSTGEVIKAFSIITCEANPLMAEIHNEKKRMPFILEHTEQENWINPDSTKEQIAAQIKQFPQEKMVAEEFLKEKPLSLF